MRRNLALSLAAVAALTAGAGVLTALPASAAAGCTVAYSVASQWQGGFGANVTVTNLGDAVSSWSLTWSFGAGQTVGQLWNGTVSQAGSQVTVSNASYNAAIPSGGSAGFGTLTLATRVLVVRRQVEVRQLGRRPSRAGGR